MTFRTAIKQQKKSHNLIPIVVYELIFLCNRWELLTGLTGPELRSSMQESDAE